MVIAEFDEETYTYLVQMLNEKFYSITDLNELSMINRIYKILGHKAETWLSARDFN